MPSTPFLAAWAPLSPDSISTAVDSWDLQGALLVHS